MPNEPQDLVIEARHSVFDAHAFMASCYECMAHTLCVRFVQSFDDENADFCRPCFIEGKPQELGFKPGLFCLDCAEVDHASN